MNNKEFFDYVKKSGHSCAAGDRYLKNTQSSPYELWHQGTIVEYILAMTMQFGISKQLTTRCIMECLHPLYLGYNDAFQAIEDWLENNTNETRQGVLTEYHNNFIPTGHGRLDRLTYLLGIPNAIDYYNIACLTLKTKDMVLASEWIHIIKEHVNYKDLKIAQTTT